MEPHAGSDRVRFGKPSDNVRTRCSRSTIGAPVAKASGASYVWSRSSLRTSIACIIAGVQRTPSSAVWNGYRDANRSFAIRPLPDDGFGLLILRNHKDYTLREADRSFRKTVLIERLHVRVEWRAEAASAAILIWRVRESRYHVDDAALEWIQASTSSMPLAGPSS